MMRTGADGVCMGTRVSLQFEDVISGLMEPVRCMRRVTGSRGDEGPGHFGFRWRRLDDQVCCHTALRRGLTWCRSTIHDDIQGSNIFHELYDARALIGNSYRDYLNGVSAADLLTQHNAAKSAKDESRSIQFM